MVSSEMIIFWSLIIASGFSYEDMALSKTEHKEKGYHGKENHGVTSNVAIILTKDEKQYARQIIQLGIPEPQGISSDKITRDMDGFTDEPVV